MTGTASRSCLMVGFVCSGVAPSGSAIWNVIFCTYKACSKKDWTFAKKTSFYNILSTAPFKVVPSTGDTLFPTFLPLLECILERTFYDGAQFSYRIFLNLRLFKKRPNFLNSSPTSTEGALRLLNAASGRFWKQTAICPVSLWALCTCSAQRISSTTNAHSETGQWQFIVKTCR